jgi:hypothetical protein
LEAKSGVAVPAKITKSCVIVKSHKTLFIAVWTLSVLLNAKGSD